MDSSTSPSLIDYDRFSTLTADRAQRLLRLTCWLSTPRPTPLMLTRPLVADVLSQAIQMEEFLDAYGARNNRQWSRFRSLTATLKLFADIVYKLLHIQHSLPSYRLLPAKRDFAMATLQSLEFTHEILVKAAQQITAQATRLNLTML